MQNNGSPLIFELPSIIRLASDLQSIVTIRNIDETLYGIIHLQNNGIEEQLATRLHHSESQMINPQHFQR